MARTTTVEQGTEMELETGCSLTCECWDCGSYRRHLLRLAALILLVCGLGGEVAWQQGLWRAGSPGGAAEVELAAATVPTGAEWF
jgi:hypothetical protein